MYVSTPESSRLCKVDSRVACALLQRRGGERDRERGGDDHVMEGRNRHHRVVVDHPGQISEEMLFERQVALVGLRQLGRRRAAPLRVSVVIDEVVGRGRKHAEPQQRSS